MKHLLAKQRVPPMTRHLVEKCSVVICSVALTLLAERVSMNTTEHIYKNAVKSVVSIASYEISTAQIFTISVNNYQIIAQQY